MATITSIDDVDDPRLIDYRDLTSADRRPDRPGGRGLVIAEGVVVVRRLLASRYRVRSLLGVARRIDELGEDLTGLDAPAYVTDADTMARVVGFHLNRGVLAVADRVPDLDVAALAARAGMLAVLEGVGDHENLGSIFRNAAALGVDGVLLGPRCADPLYRRSVRVSMGHVLRVPFGPLPGPWPDALGSLRDAGLVVAALTPSAEAIALSTVAAELEGSSVTGAAEGGPRVAVLLGAEGPGLSAAALAAADLRVRIPMADGVDSLNVATAAAIAFHAVAAVRAACPPRSPE